MGRLLEAMSVQIGYNAVAKHEFASAAAQALRRLYKILKIKPEGKRPTITFNPGGIAVSGEVTLHSDSFYVQVSQSSMGPGHEVMYRAVKDQKDYTGGINHWATAAELENTEVFAKRLVRVLEEER